MQFVSNGMQHTTSTVMVFQSDDYNKFHMIKGNRTLDMNKIKKIMADIDRGTNLLKFCPILCVERGKKLEIIDGQHRFMVARKVKSPVFYIMGEELSLYDIARMNSNTEKWKANDFINCYKELGNKHYIRLDEFIKEYPGIAITTIINILYQGKVLNGGHAAIMNKFQRGEFEVLHEERAVDLLSQAKAFEFSDKFSRAFLNALHKVNESGIFNVDDLAQKVNENIGLMQHQDHWRKYLTNMEEIVSKGKSKRVAIY